MFLTSLISDPFLHGVKASTDQNDLYHSWSLKPWSVKWSVPLVCLYVPDLYLDFSFQKGYRSFQNLQTSKALQLHRSCFPRIEGVQINLTCSPSLLCFRGLCLGRKQRSDWYLLGFFKDFFDLYQFPDQVLKKGEIRENKWCKGLVGFKDFNGS